MTTTKQPRWRGEIAFWLILGTSLYVAYWIWQALTEWVHFGNI